ncbi:uncharacterized protein LOC133800236 [Humulus lupulus]|uniref:uncharacterized protein LOC133800236 n=1 Tax=Humulus lupulus TaxID=3486 RepID=UPI002B400C4C|nr:uncharacterized protein LOC133800236 [Humulus lupulus]
MARGGAQTRSSTEQGNGSENTNRFSVLEPNDRPPGENPRSPYYISNGDQSVVNLVPKILTGCENYSSWRRSMIVALAARNKIKFVDGRLPEPEDDDEEYDVWFRCNSLVISWILHAISSEIADSVMYLDNAARIWFELQERYHQKNAPRVFEAKRSMQALVQGSNSVTTYFTKLKSFWDLIQEFRPQPVCSCGAMKIIQEYQDEDRVLEFLIGLNESYSNARSQILMQDPFPNINKAFASVV